MNHNRTLIKWRLRSYSVYDTITDKSLVSNIICDISMDLGYLLGSLLERMTHRWVGNILENIKNTCVAFKWTLIRCKWLITVKCWGLIEWWRGEGGGV